MDLVNYIVKDFAPIWFCIRCISSCKDGSKHLWDTIQKCRDLSDELKAVVDPVILCSGYFGHPENILLSMISNERRYIHELGMRRILRARSEKYGIREFCSDIEFCSK